MKDNIETLCDEIEKEIWESYIDENGKAEPIIDGIVNINQYLKAQPKILWILKEPYDEEEDGLASGGGWHFSRDFLGRDDFYQIMGASKNTWHPIIYVSYGILNNFLQYIDMDYIRDDLSMVEAIRQIAFINVKKLPGFTRTDDFGIIRESYNKHKSILHKQINTYDPDIVIGGSTMPLFYEELGIKENDIIGFGSVNYAIKNNKIFIDAYHPGQTQVTRDIYVNDIIQASQRLFNL
jgi:hypothetical protein